MPPAVRTYLEMTDAASLDAVDAPAGDAIVERAEDPPASLWRFLYAEVGREYHWVDRLGWSDEEALGYLRQPGLELWVLRVAGELAGYFELRQDGDGGVEIAYF